MRTTIPVANGIRTDHPYPGVPFIDDSHLPITDGQAIEALGRHDRNKGWGRFDGDQQDQRRWNAFTNDQDRLQFAWLVRNDPEHGRTVLLYASGDETLMHESPRRGDALTHRAGGYWWDGQQWYRPNQIYDAATEEPVRIPVPDGASITAADYLTTTPGIAAKGHIADIATFTPGSVDDAQWAHDLARWAANRPADGLALDRCVVDVSAAELDRDELVSKSGVGRLTGLSRSEVAEAMQADPGSRGQCLPWPQRHTHYIGSPRWSRPVLQNWLWERQRADPAPVVAHLRTGARSPGPEGLLWTITSAVLWQMQASSSEGYLALGLPLERVLGWIVTDRPSLAESLFGDIVRSARDLLELADKDIAATLRHAVQWGIEDPDSEDVIEEFLHRTLPPSVADL